MERSVERQVDQKVEQQMVEVVVREVDLQLRTCSLWGCLV